MTNSNWMATPQPLAVAEAKKKPKTKGGQHQFPCRSFRPKKPSFAEPLQGLEHIPFNNTGTAKAASTFNLNIKAISKHIANRLKFDGPLAALAICELKSTTINFPPNPSNSANLFKTSK
jgi:hypothetical protein